MDFIVAWCVSVTWRVKTNVCLSPAPHRWHHHYEGHQRGGGGAGRARLGSRPQNWRGRAGTRAARAFRVYRWVEKFRRCAHTVLTLDFFLNSYNSSFLSLSVSQAPSEVESQPSISPSCSSVSHPPFTPFTCFFSLFWLFICQAGNVLHSQNCIIFCAYNKTRLYWRLECVFILTGFDGICRISGLHDQQQLVAVGTSSKSSLSTCAEGQAWREKLYKSAPRWHSHS